MTAFPQRLIDGYGAFRVGRLAQERERYATLATAGQAPKIMVIGCCDSRVSPEVIFDCGPGEIFVVRNVANLVPPYAPDGHYHGTSAAIEFAVRGLNVRHIVIMGHARCGGIAALMKGPCTEGAEDNFIGQWMTILDPVLERVGRYGSSHEARREALELAAIGESLENLMSFPFVRERMARGAMELHGAYFDVATGELKLRDPVSGEFLTPPSA